MTIHKLDAEQSHDLATKLHLANYSGGSSAGMHYWSDAAKCGMRAVLSDRQKRERLDDHAAIPPLEDQSKIDKSAFAVGSAYHKLHELLRNGELPLANHTHLSVKPEHLSASHVEALRLFNGWMSFWPVDMWGDVVAIEKEVVVADMFDDKDLKVSAMPDLVVSLKKEHVEMASARLGHVIAPGNYIVDFKTSDQPYSDLYYKGGLQALWYPIAGNACEDVQVEGVIFDAIHKFGRRKDKSITHENFGAVYSPIDDSAERALQGMVLQGAENIRRAHTEGMGNRSECMAFNFGGVKTCQFYGNGCTNET
jgi:hypothetical protein